MMALAGLWAAGAFVVYVLFGYPALLWLMARRRARPVRRGECEPTVSILLAVYNGERFLEQKLRSILELEYPREKMQVIVASDGSTDATEEIAERFAAQGVRLLRLERGGKPAALNAAMREATGEMLVFTDVRQALEPGSLRRLMENFADAEVGAASGELVVLEGAGRGEADMGLYWRYEVWIRLRLSALDSIFGASGAYYAMRRTLTKPLPTDALLDDMHLPLAAFFQGYRLIVDPRARMFDYPAGMETEFRRKVRTLAGNYQILRAYPALLGPANRMWLHYVSYKFARLLLPFAMIVFAACSLAAPAPWGPLLWSGEALFCAAAAADLVIPEKMRLKRITSPVRAFVTLMAAALAAVSIFFLPSRRLWRPTQLKP
jgi:cellulose synthase/poly-beta-1,6-N-acetylglucosamine synthase-like glycosyltransferase